MMLPEFFSCCFIDVNNVNPSLSSIRRLTLPRILWDTSICLLEPETAGRKSQHRVAMYHGDMSRQTRINQTKNTQTHGGDKSITGLH